VSQQNGLYLSISLQKYSSFSDLVNLAEGVPVDDDCILNISLKLMTIQCSSYPRADNPKVLFPIYQLGDLISRWGHLVLGWGDRTNVISDCIMLTSTSITGG